jgi:GT2 family glycosyltransferase
MFVLPPVAKPIPHVVLSRTEGERPGDLGSSDARLTLIDVGVNLGFAGGCNVGMRYALRDESCGYVWLLNNDTVVDPAALSALVRRLAARPDAGQCGSRILSFSAPNLVQARGGERYNRWLASSRAIGAGRPSGEGVDATMVERDMSYVAGASLCVTRAFIEQVGLLDESYFLYGEELDWLARARGRFALAYAHDSIVYHKEGSTIGSSRDGASRTALSDYYMVRSRVRFTWKHARLALPTVVLGVLVAGINRIRRRQLDRALAILRILLTPGTYSSAGTRVPPKSLT